MTYADTDFFLALLKPSDWLKKRAEEIRKQYAGEIWTSPVTMIELLLLAKRLSIDPERLLVDALEIAELRGVEANPYLLAAHYIKVDGVGVFDALHAAHCGADTIISSDRVFDRLGLRRIDLRERRRAA